MYCLCLEHFNHLRGLIYTYSFWQYSGILSRAGQKSNVEAGSPPPVAVALPLKLGLISRHSLGTQALIPVTPLIPSAGRSQFNFTDPESLFLQTSQDSFQWRYWFSVVADAGSRLLVSSAAIDQSQLPCRLDSVQAHCGHFSSQV